MRKSNNISNKLSLIGQNKLKYSKQFRVNLVYIYIFTSLFISLLFTNLDITKAQGFDWYYSNRLPFSTPNLFIGGNIEGQSLSYNADLPIKRYFNTNELECCRYNDGDGRGFKFGINAEYWYETFQSINISLNYHSMPLNFKKMAEPIPLSNGDNLITEYDYQSNLSLLNLEIGWKYKIAESHFFVNPSLDINYFLDRSKGTHTESIVSPDYETFSDGSLIKNLDDVILPKINSLNYNFNLKAGYDYSPIIGIYLSPYLGYTFSLSNYIEEKNLIGRSQTLGFNGFLFGFRTMINLN